MLVFKIIALNIKVVFKWLLLIGTAYYFIYLVNLIQQPPFFVLNQQRESQMDSNRKTVTIDRKLFDYLAFHLRNTEYDGIDNYIRFMTALMDLKELSGVKPLVPGMGPVVNDISWFQYPISITPCHNPASSIGNSIGRSLFIAVISGPGNFERRASIRRTWPVHFKNQFNSKNPLDLVGFGFVIGQTNDSLVQQKLKDESEKYGDVLQINMVDTYVDLSIKVAGLFHWLDTFCSQVDYVLKVDDDVYVNVHNLAAVLHSLTVSEQSIYGRQCGGNLPERRDGKWKTSFKNWPWQRFPIYFQGGGVVIAGSAVRPILAAMQVTPYFIWDDMYLIGLCAVKAKVQLRTSNQIFVDMPENPADPCFVRNNVMWTTGSADIMNASHFAIQSFYRQPSGIIAGCVHNGKVISHEASASEFPFGTAREN